ncbi:MAG: DUF4358 domain-containing protein [Oscillospiraceae bacterium]|nr:DUF4358 domain-containing protein [Oscillospiraceae bacterium]
MKFFKIFLALFLIFAISSCNKAKGADLNDTYAKIDKAGVLPLMVSVSKDDIENLYGINTDDLKQYVFKIAVEGTLADEVVLIEVKDSSKVSEIEKRLQTRLDNKAEEAKSYSPEQYAIIMKSSVETKGNYVSIIVSPNAPELIDIYNSNFK